MDEIKYLIVEIQTMADGRVANLAYQKDDYFQAQAQYHSVLAAAAVSGVPVHAAVLLNNRGVQLEYKAYSHYVPEESNE